MRYDLLIKGGQVLDPAAGLTGNLDVAVSAGTIVAVEPGLDPQDARRTVDVDGAFVVPGLIDLHVHSFWGCGFWGLEHEPIAIRTGVTTAVDAGSAGGYNLAGFRRYVIERERIRTLVFLNMSSIGLTAPVNELMDLYYADAPLAERTARENSDLVVGLKVRLNPNISGDHGLEALERTVEVAQRLELPVMVHVAGRPPELGEILARLRRGDIITHCCNMRANKIVDDAGRIRADVRQARARGVLLDVGHGQGSFGFQVAEQILAEGIFPDTISSDLHAHNVAGPVFDLPTTMSKFLNLGMPLEEVIASVTSRAAAAIGRKARLGTLSPGTPADIAAVAVERGQFPLIDSHHNERTGDRRLVNHLTVAGGRVLYQG